MFVVFGAVQQYQEKTMSKLQINITKYNDVTLVTYICTNK